MLNKIIEGPMAKPEPLAGATENSLQLIKNAQYDMRVAYLYGSTGVLASGLIWLAAALVAIYLSPDKAVWTLLIGGAFIHPIGILLNKILGASGAHTQANALGRLAMESTVFMIMCLPVAYLLSFQKTEWFFQATLLIIGGRYLTFATLYGTRLYWILGIGLGIAAYLLFVLNSPSSTSMFVGAAMEITFGLILLSIAQKNKTTSGN